LAIDIHDIQSFSHINKKFATFLADLTNVFQLPTRQCFPDELPKRYYFAILQFPFKENPNHVLPVVLLL